MKPFNKAENFRLLPDDEESRRQFVIMAGRFGKTPLLEAMLADIKNREPQWTACPICGRLEMR